ncbi:MAG: cbb3-type cytochrome c oxidase N-terminal domain-containing protein [Saprospiraceae bacterium]|jgi:cytochrome c oxidase cbb3-type subunit 3
MMKKLFLTIITLFTTILGVGSLYAQDAAATAESAGQSTPNVFNSAYNNILLILAVLVLIGVILAGLSLIWALIEVQKMKLLEKFGPEGLEKANLTASGSLWSTISEKAWNLVPKDKEADIDLGHEYDGIRELDNSLPPWWLWLFYGTIIWAAVYIWYYHISGKGPNQEQEYIAAMEIGDAEKAKFLATQADIVDEKTVTALIDAAAIAEGKEIYVTNCQVCHGANGEGTVGPNFSDKYWLHGGSINDIFTTIKYGVPEKGMISWKAQLKPASIQKVASFILTFQGTNPPNAKAPQGDLYEPSAANGSTATPTATDTTKVSQPTEAHK